MNLVRTKTWTMDLMSETYLDNGRDHYVQIAVADLGNTALSVLISGHAWGSKLFVSAILPAHVLGSLDILWLFLESLPLNHPVMVRWLESLFEAFHELGGSLERHFGSHRLPNHVSDRFLDDHWLELGVLMRSNTITQLWQCLALSAMRGLV